jgi:hypothetical protein
MDDSNDNVRIGILPAIIAFFTTMPSSFNDSEVTNSFNHNYEKRLWAYNWYANDQWIDSMTTHHLF